jgi:hypothetical protein
MPFDFAQPAPVADLTDCFFYHKIDLPGFGTVGGDWDLRACAHAYLGNQDFAGKRALDMGAASGFLTFEMEHRGASVVSYDIRTGADWNIVPHYKLRDRLPQMRRDADEAIRRLKNAYWFSHRRFRSQAQVYYGDIYGLPAELGDFDVVFYGMILTHIRDPFQALYSGARLSRDTVVVTGSFARSEAPTSTFRPDAADTSNLGVKSWWLLSIGTMRRMLGVLGFEIVDFEALCLAAGHEGPRRLQAIVAKRAAA